MLNKINILLVVLLLNLAFCQEHYKKIVHNTDPEAKCLDGSPSMYYINEGI